MLLWHRPDDDVAAEVERHPGTRLRDVPAPDRRPHARHVPLDTQMSRQRRHAGWCFWALGALIAAYALSVLLRGPSHHWTWLDGWAVCGFEFALSALCLTRGMLAKHHRAAPLFLGMGLLSWSIGDLLLTVETLGGAHATSPSPADVFYLGFYPLAYVATVLLLRATVGTISKPNWLDGVVAGLGAAAG